MSVTKAVLSGAIIAGFAASAAAAPIIFTGSSGGLAAQATFDVVGPQLIVTLTNTAANTPTGTDTSAGGLAALFFDLPDAILLTQVSALITSGAIIQGSTCDLGGPANGDNSANCTAAQTNVGGEFDYVAGASIPGAADRGIGSSGFGIFADGSFGGANLDDPDAVNGANFLLISANEINFNPNGGLANDPLIKGTVTFTFNFTGGPLANADIDDVFFQYGTSLTEPGFGGTPGGNGGPPGQTVPEPSALLLIGAGLLGLAANRRRRPEVRS